MINAFSEHFYFLHNIETHFYTLGMVKHFGLLQFKIEKK